MRRRRRLLAEEEGLREVWPAFTDVMSTLALVLFTLVLLAYVRNIISSKRLDAYERQIAGSEKQLAALQQEVAAERSLLAASDAKLRDQRALAADTHRELDAVRAQVQNIAVLRVSVLSKLKAAIEAELGTSGEAGTALATIGDNGNVVINESLVFEYNSYAIKSDGKPLLDTLARALARVLSDSDVRDNIDTILIQGHTDRRGSAALNWDLSAKRATAVLDYLFRANKTLADEYGGYFAAAAYSKFRPIDPRDTEAAYQQNRRIEISVIPKDESVRKVIDEYLSGQGQSVSSPPAGVAP
jgi:chemotaxis protein MotB